MVYEECLIMDIAVSIIMPVYNAAKYVERAISSVLDGSPQCMEVICVDDCSQDSSYEVLNQLALGDSRIKVYRNVKNMGAGYTKNVAISYARGKFICFCDSDDYFATGAVETMLRIVSSSNCADGIYFGSYLKQSENGEVVESGYVKGLAGNLVYASSELYSAILSAKLFVSSACRVMIKKTVLQEYNIRFSEGTYCDDWFFSFCLASSPVKLYYFKEALYYYCIHEGSVTSNICSTQYISELYDIYMEYALLYDESIIRHKIEKYVYASVSNAYFKFSKRQKRDFVKIIIDKYSAEAMRRISHCSYSRYFNKMDVLADNVRAFKKIYIYGAGDYAIDAFRLLKAKNIKISSFVVSAAVVEITSLAEVPIVSVSDVDDIADESVGIIVAVSKVYENEILLTLKKYMAKNIFCLE